MCSVYIKWLLFKTPLSSHNPFCQVRTQQNSSETEVIVLLNTRNTFIYLIKKPQEKWVGTGSDLFSTHPWESWCPCQQFRNQQATWRWVIRTSTKPKAPFLQRFWSVGAPAARQGGRELRHSPRLSMDVSPSACWPGGNVRALLVSAVQSRRHNFL